MQVDLPQRATPMTVTVSQLPGRETVATQVVPGCAL